MTKQSAEQTFEGIIEPAIEASETFREQSRTALKPQPSQKPGPEMMDACIAGNAEAIAIRDSWKFSHPVRVVGREEFAAMIANQGSVVFNG